MLKKLGGVAMFCIAGLLILYTATLFRHRGENEAAIKAIEEMGGRMRLWPPWWRPGKCSVQFSRENLSGEDLERLVTILKPVVVRVNDPSVSFTDTAITIEECRRLQQMLPGCYISRSENG